MSAICPKCGIDREKGLCQKPMEGCPALTDDYPQARVAAVAQACASALKRMREYPGGSYMRCPYCGCKSSTHDADCPVEVLESGLRDYACYQRPREDTHDERSRAEALANRVLERVNADPDDDLALLARQLLRSKEEITRLRGDVYASEAACRAAGIAWEESGWWRSLQEITHNDLALAIKQAKE